MMKYMRAITAAVAIGYMALTMGCGGGYALTKPDPNVAGPNYFDPKPHMKTPEKDKDKKKKDKKTIEDKVVQNK